MASRKSKDEEKLDFNTLERVISYLETKGATKKVACQMLNISYNVSRLDKLLETHKKKKEDDLRRRAEKRGKPATPQEIDYVVTEYLQGENILNISKALFRGTTFVHSILDNLGVPKRDSNTPNTGVKPVFIPDESTADEFKEEEVVYSARYHTLAKVIREVKSPQGKAYRIWLKGEWQQYAYQPVWELASLNKLREAGINI